jgi:allophanate hydrolase subunit 1
MEAQGFHLRFTSTLDMSDIKNRLFEIITMVSQFKKLTCTNSIDAQYIETVRDSINAIESKLTIFRSISLEEQQVLKKMEHELELELAAIQDHCTKQPVKSEKIQPIGHSIPQVIDFQVFFSN